MWKPQIRCFLLSFLSCYILSKWSTYFFYFIFSYLILFCLFLFLSFTFSLSFFVYPLISLSPSVSLFVCLLLSIFLRSPHFLNEVVTLERLLIPIPITEVITEDRYCPINIEIEESSTKQRKKEEICQNSRFKCLKKHSFHIFYEAKSDFKNYIKDILKNNFKLKDHLFAENVKELRKQEEKLMAIQ